MARSDGSVFKICRCRDPHTRKPLGNTCPKLRRANRAWSTNHGQWAYQIELPPTADGQRRQLRPTGFADRAAAEREMDHVRRLLDLAEGDRHRLVELADSIQISRRATASCPTSRRYGSACAPTARSAAFPLSPNTSRNGCTTLRWTTAPGAVTARTCAPI